MKFYYLAILFLISFKSFSQVTLDVWDKKKKVGKTFSRDLSSESLPNSFVSKTPDGGSLVYERWNTPKISITTSSGKKTSLTPIVYKSTNTKNWSVINLTKNGWIGNYISQSKSYSMSYDQIYVNKKENKVSESDICKLDIPIKNTKIQKTPQVGKITDISLYDSTYFVQKTCSLYVEADYKLFQDFNGNSQSLIDWINQTYSCVGYLYYREGVRLNLVDLYIWDTPDDAVYPPIPSGGVVDPYFATTLMTYFKARPLTTNCFFRQLISSKGSVSGLGEWGSDADGYNVDFPILMRHSTVLVSPSQLPPIDLTDVDNMNQNIMAITHELGHNLGSPHTHFCKYWKSKTGQLIPRLDSCFYGQIFTNVSSSGCDNISPIRRDETVPSIMGYCGYRPYHTIQQQLVNGFKTLPRWAIKATLLYSNQIPLDDIPTVTTGQITSITGNSSTLSGSVTSDGGSQITSRGFVWSTVSNPVIGSTNQIIISGTTGNFSAQLTNLNSNVTYFVRSFATNSNGTSYGQNKSFFTSSNPLPVVQTGDLFFENAPFNTSCALFNNTKGCGIGNVKVVSQGAMSVEVYGLVWSRTSNPTLTQGGFAGNVLDFVPSTSDGVGDYQLNFGPLDPDSIYYIRAFAKNDFGTSYGVVKQIKTPSLKPGIQTLQPINLQTGTSENPIFRLKGKIIHPGLTEILNTKFQISKKINQNSLGVDNAPIIFEGQTNIYPDYIKDFISEKKQLYEVRFVASNQSNPTTPLYTTLGEKILFYTGQSPSSPILKYNKLISSSPTLFTLACKIYSPGSSPILLNDSGVPIVNFYYRSISEVVFQKLPVNYVNNSEDSLIINLSNLASGTSYQGYFGATNSVGVGISNIISFSTSGPEIITNTATSITPNSAICGGNVISDGGSPVFAKGLVYSTSPQPTVINSAAIGPGAGGIGSFIVNMPGLVSGTTYYVRAYATNYNGTYYGNEITFTTLPLSSPPTVVTGTSSNPTLKTITISGQVTQDGGSPVLERGFCYTTVGNGQNQGTLPTISNTKLICGSGTGSYNGVLPNLFTPSPQNVDVDPITQLPSDGQTYYIRAYASSIMGTSYGQVVVAKTDFRPKVTTDIVVPWTINSFICDGTVLSSGIGTLYERGRVTSSSSNPTLSPGGSIFAAPPGNDFSTSATPGALNLGQFTSTDIQLNTGSTYYVRAWAETRVGPNLSKRLVGYGDVLQVRIPSSNDGNCSVGKSVKAYQEPSPTGPKWYFDFAPSLNCDYYKVELLKYATNPTNNPSAQILQSQVLNGLNVYMPTTQELTANMIRRLMKPQPTATTTTTWYSVKVTCQSTIGSCILGTNKPVEFYFPVSPNQN